MQTAVSRSRGAGPHLPVGCSFLRLWDALVHIEDTGDAQLDAVQVTPYHCPQPEQPRLAGLSDLQDMGYEVS